MRTTRDIVYSGFLILPTLSNCAKSYGVNEFWPSILHFLLLIPVRGPRGGVYLSIFGQRQGTSWGQVASSSQGWHIETKNHPHSGAVVSTVTSKQESSILVRAFQCGVCMFSLCLGGFSLGTPPTVQKHAKLGFRLIGHSKLPLGVHLSVDGCLSLYVNPAMNWQLVHGDPCLHLKMLR